MRSNKLLNFINHNKWIIVFLLMIPFFNDGYVTFKIVEDWLMDSMKVFAFLSMIVLLLVKKKKISRLTICLIAIEIWWFISTMLNYPLSESEVYYKLIIDNINAISVALIVELFIDEPISLINGLILNMELAIYPNLFTVLMLPKGSGYYLLGYYALFALWILPSICIGFLYMYLNKKIVRGSLLIVACLITSLWVWNATTIVALMALFGFLIFGTALKWLKNTKLPSWIFVCLVIILNVFVLFAYSGGNFPLIDFFIERILHKSTTFTGRTEIWREAIRMIQEKPIIGHGFRPIVYATNEYGSEYLHCHNQLLQRLNATGIIGLLLFALFHIEAIYKIDQSENSYERIVMIAGILGVCMTYITDAYKKFFRFYLIFFLAYYVNELVNEKIVNTKELIE